ncbi:MAG: DUF1501 domain-containing protein [bacterium]|nr:DUF1501 domain-containing protein [Candidatus Kapabacteria bacterium]
MKRRDFIQRLAGTGIVLPFALGYPRVRAFAKSPAGSPFMKLMSADTDRVLVIIRLAGGNDGLNTLVPFTDPEYYRLRKQGSADDLSIAENTVVRIDGNSTLGLHPSLAALKPLFTEGKVNVVQNVGYEGQNQSHFRSTDIWLSGSDATVYDNSGWYGRYLETEYPDYPDVLPADPFAIELGTYLSTTLIGRENNMGVAVADLSYVPGQPDSDPVAGTRAGTEEAYVREIMRQSNIFSNAIIAAAIRQTTNIVTYPVNNALGAGLAPIARLIKAGLKTKMYIVNVGGYDTHGNQLATQANLHKQFADAVFAFQRDLEGFGIADRVSTMTISEFGRRAEGNGTGTDHGSAAPLFVIGSSVKSGFIGSDPNLTDLEGRGNIKMQHDFRQVYASVLGQWFGATEAQITPGALPRHFDQLPIFDAPQVSAPIADGRRVSFTLGQNYPNPAINATVIPIDGMLGVAGGTLSVFTNGGRLVHEQSVPAGKNAVTVDTRALAPGSYVYELSSGGVREAKKMSVVR